MHWAHFWFNAEMWYVQNYCQLCYNKASHPKLVEVKAISKCKLLFSRGHFAYKSLEIKRSGLIWSSSATTKREFRPFPCSNTVPIEAKKSRLVLKSRLVVTDENGISNIWLIFKHNEELKLRKSRFFDPENQHVQIASIIMNPKYYVTLRNTEVIRFSIARFSVITDYFYSKSQRMS